MNRIAPPVPRSPFYKKGRNSLESVPMGSGIVYTTRLAENTGGCWISMWKVPSENVDLRTRLTLLQNFINYLSQNLKTTLPDGVTGNTPDSGSGVSRFEPWSGSQIGRRSLILESAAFFFWQDIFVSERIMNCSAASRGASKWWLWSILSTPLGLTHQDNPLSPPLGKGDYLLFPWGWLPRNKASRNSFRLNLKL